LSPPETKERRSVSLEKLLTPELALWRAAGRRPLLEDRAARVLCLSSPTEKKERKTGSIEKLLTPMLALHVEYEERGNKYGIIFTFSVFYEYSNLEYVRVPVLYRVNVAEYVIRILVALTQEYVNSFSTRRMLAL